MAEASTLKLIIDKGPREGETRTYSPGPLIKIGRVVRGNTIAIKDAGISSNHICIQFDNQLSKWTLCDLDSSNGTFLNAQILKPYIPSSLHDGDCIKIGELTSIIVKIGDESDDSAVRPRRNPRRQVKYGAESAGPAAVVKKEMIELELGFDGDLGRNEVKEAVERRNLRTRSKKGVELKNEVESLSSMRVLRSSKKEITENLNVDAIKVADVLVLVEPRKTRGRKKMAVQPVGDCGLDEGKVGDSVVLVDGRRTRGRTKRLRVEPLAENLNNGEGTLQVDEGNAATCDKGLEGHLENVKGSALGENPDTNNESAEEHVVSPQKDCEGKTAGTGADNGRWQDLEEMTLSDFFRYMEVQLPKEIYDKSEKIISGLKEKAGKYHEFRLQRNESGKGKLVVD